MNTAKQVGGALGLAVLVTVTGTHSETASALAASYGHAFLLIALLQAVIVAAALALPPLRDQPAATAGRSAR